MLQVVRTVGLETTVSQLEEGLDTPIAATGWPLSITETMQLKLAAAVLARPRILILNQIFDVMPESRLRASLDLLQEESETSVICFSNRYGNLGFDHFLNLAQEKQTLHRSFDAMLEAAGGRLEIESSLRGRASSEV
jgi:putative ABC transport system ATP-binding protein